jgi:integrase
MASLTKHEQTQAWRILFADKSRTRRAVYLGKLAKRRAEEIKRRIEELVELSITNAAKPTDLARWVAGLDDKLASKLAKVNLIDTREARPKTGLRAAWDAHIQRMADEGTKQGTLLNWHCTANSVVEFCGANTELGDVTKARAQAYQAWLKRDGLAAPTIHKYLQRARKLFAVALKNKLVSENPFDEVRQKIGRIDHRRTFVSGKDALLCMEHAPNEVWRIMIALSRFGGLRCPSETFSLRWEHIDWKELAITVVSPKSAHTTKAERCLPMFAELKRHLERYRDCVPSSDGYLIPWEYRKRASGENGWRNANLRTTMLKIIKKAGLQPWPKPFHNLRASCQQEVATEHGLENAARWLGNDAVIAQRHYLMNTDATHQHAITADTFGTLQARVE